MTIGRIPSVEGGIQPTIVDAKGDLIVATAADSVNRLAVGSNDQVLVADSSTSTGLAWKSYGAQFVAGKNKIINGDFRIWQRGTTFNAITTNAYSADRWTNTIGNTVNVTQQTFTAGTAPVAGYEGQYFIRYDRTTSTTTDWLAVQKIEDVRTFAGQTVTLSFWAKVSSGTLTPTNVYINQNFGSGGSSTVDATGFTPTFTTSWARYSYTVTLGSISGKTIGTGSFISTQMQFASTKGNFTLDIWGMQLEAGSVATPFTTATGTIQGELAACQRYYQRYESSASYAPFGTGFVFSATQTIHSLPFQVRLRGNPSVSYSAGNTFAAYTAGGTVTAATGTTTDRVGTNSLMFALTASTGSTSGYGAFCIANAGAAAYIEISSEL